MANDRKALDLRPRAFEYLLNAMELAAQAENPAGEGYAAKRRAVLAYVETLRMAALQPAVPPSVPEPVAWILDMQGERELWWERPHDIRAGDVLTPLYATLQDGVQQEGEK